MSIYATLWILRFPAEGDSHSGCDWIEVLAQSVPPHIGTPTVGNGYEAGDPYASFLPPPVAVDAKGDAPYARAVIFVTKDSLKGTERSGQEYAAPLLVLTGKEYAEISFEDLHSRLCARLRGNRAPVVAEIFSPDNPPKTIRGRL